MQPPPQPTRPSSVEGWKKRYDKEAGFSYCAVLLLRKGESTDNGKFGVRVTDIIEGENCCGDPGYRCYRRAKIQFYRPTDGQVLCELEIQEHSNAAIDCMASLDGVSVIGGRAINTKEGWVLFDLRC